MAFTNTQTHELKAKLDSKHVKTRKANGDTLHYVEGWHVIAEANRIFGHEGWDRETITTACVWSGANGEYHSATYIAKVRVIVRAGDIVVVREGSGTGEGRAFTSRASPRVRAQRRRDRRHQTSARYLRQSIWP